MGRVAKGWLLTFAVVASVAVVPRGVAADGIGLRAGDTLIVASGPAPVKVRSTAVTTVEAGHILTALDVKGDWVKVAVGDDDKAITGWIHRSRICRFIRSQSRPQTQSPAHGSRRSAVTSSTSGSAQRPAAATESHVTQGPKGSGQHNTPSDAEPSGGAGLHSTIGTIFVVLVIFGLLADFFHGERKLSAGPPTAEEHRRGRDHAERMLEGYRERGLIP